MSTFGSGCLRFCFYSAAQTAAVIEAILILPQFLLLSAFLLIESVTLFLPLIGIQCLIFLPVRYRYDILYYFDHAVPFERA